MKEIKLNVVLQYDQETDTIVSYKATIDGVANKTTTTRKASTVKTSGLEGSLLVREDNKLVLSDQLLLELGAVAEDRISIRYENKDKKLFPVIGLDINFGDKGNGNKLTKSHTIAFKGKQNETLAPFGTQFTIEPYKEGVFKLIGENAVEFDSTPAQVNKKVDLAIETKTDTNYSIEEMNFSL